MKYTIYKITNKVNGKIYIGKHQTNNINDGYMGSGILLKRAQTKYGAENFVKEILHIFDTEKEMNAKEAELVTEEFCLREDTYNMCVGGKGGFSYINNNRLNTFCDSDIARFGREKTDKILEEKHGENWRSVISKKANDRLKQILKSDPNYLKDRASKSFLGRKHSEETKRKIGLKNSESSKGPNNSQYGTIWINNGEHNKKIKGVDPIPEGWYKGRIVNKQKV